MSIKNPILGILGGMGPYATQYFYKRILDLTPAKKDWEHLRIIIDNNTHIPSRSRFILYEEKSPVDAMIESCEKLEKYPVDMIVIPCNSACFFIEEIASSINTPIVNIIGVTVDSIEENTESIEEVRVAVLGGAVTYYKKTYETLLLKKGYKYIHHSIELQEQVEKVIEGLKRMQLTPELLNQFKKIIFEFKKLYNVDLIILGCTEFSIIYEDIDIFEVKLIDSSTELAKYCIKSFYEGE